MKESLKYTIVATVGFTLATWFAILALWLFGAKFQFGIPVTMIIAFFSYFILFLGVSIITDIVCWLESKLNKE